MDTMSQLISDLTRQEGISSTNLPNVEVVRISRYQPPTPFNYQKGIFIVGQGSKHIYLGDKQLSYNHDNYLVLSVSLPVECEVFTSGEEPFLSLFIKIDMSDLGRIIDKMGQHGNQTLFNQEKSQLGLFISETTPVIRESACRLLKVLKSPIESEVMGKGILNEILYRILCSENAASLYSLFIKNSNLSLVDKAIMQIHQNYHKPMSVDQLAAMVNMSTSSFYRAFKEVTDLPPIQYIKKVRLNKARELFLEKRLRVGEVATAVGYESASQFSREFKRYFGNSPAEFTCSCVFFCCSFSVAALCLAKAF